MAGYVTQSRKVVFPYDDFYRYTESDFGYFTGSYNLLAHSLTHPTQTTYSFRSGGSGYVEEDEDAELLSAKTGAARTAALVKQRKKYGSRNSYDNGHPFHTTRNVFHHSNPSMVIARPDGKARMEGLIILDWSAHDPSVGSWFPTIPSFNSTWYQVQAINRTMPTHPVAGLATALGELKRDGLPSLPGQQVFKDRTKNVRNNAGSEYLNLEFAWKPMVSDLAKTLYAVSESDRLWKQYVRDSGRNVRRSYVFPEERTVLSTRGRRTRRLMDPSQRHAEGSTYLLQSGPIVTDEFVETRQIKFSGAYTYYLPSGNSITDKMERYAKEADYVLGVGLTPEVVWNLAPWSWLSDWVVNIGDNISNAVRLSQDGLVIRYGYLTIETTREYIQHVSGVVPQGGSTMAPWTISFKTIKKERIQASPFGFARNPSSFTGRQWAILAALGLTKTPNSLRQE